MNDIQVDDALTGEVVPTYDQYVESGKAAVARIGASQWELGDLAAGVECHYGDYSLERYAEDVGLKPETLKRYRWIAGAYPEKVRRRTLSFEVHSALAAQPDRHELIASKSWTVREARELVASRRGPAPIPRPGPGPGDRDQPIPGPPSDRPYGGPRPVPGTEPGPPPIPWHDLHKETAEWKASQPGNQPLPEYDLTPGQALELFVTQVERRLREMIPLTAPGDERDSLRNRLHGMIDKEFDDQ